MTAASVRRTLVRPFMLRFPRCLAAIHPRGIFSPAKEKFSLPFADWHLQLLHHLQHILPNTAFFDRGLVAKEIGGVIGEHQGRTTKSMPLAAHFGDEHGFA